MQVKAEDLQSGDRIPGPPSGKPVTVWYVSIDQDNAVCVHYRNGDSTVRTSRCSRSRCFDVKGR